MNPNIMKIYRIFMLKHSMKFIINRKRNAARSIIYKIKSYAFKVKFKIFMLKYISRIKNI